MLFLIGVVGNFNGLLLRKIFKKKRENGYDMFVVYKEINYVEI